jgi:adenine-specific DNA-methyltransferase
MICMPQHLINQCKPIVDQMFAAKKQLAVTQRDSEQLQHKFDYLDGEIDKLVYELYGLTAEEIRIVEGNE